MMVTDKSTPASNSLTLTTTRQWVLAEYPRESLDISKTFKLIESPLVFGGGQGQKASNWILVKSLWFSNDLAQRTWMTDKPEERFYIKVRAAELHISAVFRLRIFDLGN